MERVGNMCTVMEMDFIQDEISRIEPYTIMGLQAIMVQSDMKKWAVSEGHWPQMDYIHMIAAHAVAKGWTQPGIDEMEIIE